MEDHPRRTGCKKAIAPVIDDCGLKYLSDTKRKLTRNTDRIRHRLGHIIRHRDHNIVSSIFLRDHFHVPCLNQDRFHNTAHVGTVRLIARIQLDLDRHPGILGPRTKSCNIEQHVMQRDMLAFEAIEWNGNEDCVDLAVSFAQTVHAVAKTKRVDRAG